MFRDQFDDIRSDGVLYHQGSRLPAPPPHQPASYSLLSVLHSDIISEILFCILILSVIKPVLYRGSFRSPQ